MEGKRRAILFDADNTLYHTRDIAKQADMVAMRVFAKRCHDGTACCTPESLYRQFRQIVSLAIKSRQPYRRTRPHSYTILAARHGIPHHAVRIAVTAFKQQVLKRLKLVPGIIQFLKAAKHQGFILEVITEDRAAFAAAKLRKLKLAKFFSAVISADTAGTMKPNPKYFDLALARAKVKASDCIVIGDHFEKDLAYPKQRGAFTILIGSRDGRADKSVQAYAGLQKYLR